jgi:integrase/recombinase XerD
MHGMDWQLYSSQGDRKYLTEPEFRRFLSAVTSLPPEQRAFARLIAYTGCRISEGLGLRRAGIGLGAVILPTLKRRRRMFRLVPVPQSLIADLRAVPTHPDAPDAVWTVNRSTAYRWIKRAMALARIEGIHASPRGLRHALGLRAASASIPQGLLQRWFGHATPTTTAIYINAVGVEDRALIARTW